MEDEFQKNKKIAKIKRRNSVVLGTTIYILAVIVFFGLGRKLDELATAQIPLVSVDGVVKIIAIVCILIVIAIIFIPGPIVLMTTLSDYIEMRDSE